MRRKIKVIVSILMFSTGVTATTAFAARSYWPIGTSGKTYVESYHSDSYLADEYKGTVSVYGLEEIIQDGRWYYPTYSRLVYDVQGDITNLQVYSTGETDSKQRIDTVTVKDKWNAGDKTTCKYSFGKSLRSIQPTLLPPEAE